MTEVRDEFTGEPADQNISVYINSKMEAFCTDLIFPFGIPANGIISVFVGDFSALDPREGYEWTERADNVSKQKLVVLCRPYQASIDEPVSDDDVDEFLCGICKKSLRTRKSCHHHVWSHLNPADSSKRFKRPACIKAFSTSWAQKYHYKMKHVGTRPSPHRRTGYSLGTYKARTPRPRRFVAPCARSCSSIAKFASC
ncbi:hypothetical protein MRX96_059419 [Rhipicephalus microplus]